MKIKPPKFLGAWDMHKKIMLVRIFGEAVSVSVFFVLPQFSPWFKALPYQTALAWCASAALFFSIIFLALTIYRESKGQGIRIITYLECIFDAILTIPLLHCIGGINGPLFFFYSLMIMESAATFSRFVIFLVAGIGMAAVIGDFVFQLISKTMILTPSILITIFFRIVFLFLISFYGYSLSQSILRERKTKRRLGKAYQELKKLDQAKSEFIAMASHQLRTPLTIIKGYVSMLLEGTYGTLSLKSKRPLRGILESNERLIKLVNGLLTISKVEMGKIEMQFEKVDLSTLLSGLIKEFEFKAKEKGIYLRLERPKQVLPILIVDRNKLRQVIFNVLDNAIRYTNKGGITLRHEENKGRCLIIIKDTGAGMTKKETSNLFSSFSRGSAGINLWREGTGLGLYVAKKFMELHKGKIWAESKGKGKGSTFYIELPLTHRHSEERFDKLSVNSATKNLKS